MICTKLGINSNGSGKNLLHMAHNGSSSIIEEEEEVESPGTSKLLPSSDIPVDAASSTTSLPVAPKEETKTGSYLALTKLGMGKKGATDAKPENTNDSNLSPDAKTKKSSPKDTKKLKEKTGKDVAEKKKTKPMISLLR